MAGIPEKLIVFQMVKSRENVFVQLILQLVAWKVVMPLQFGNCKK